VFALRGGAAFEAFARALAEDEPAPSRPLLASDARRPVDPGLPVAGLAATGPAETPAAAAERVGDGEPA
jgi:hypothetical protein